ncbi:MAG: lipocalin family protein [Ignavibacteriales bacterium]
MYLRMRQIFVTGIILAAVIFYSGCKKSDSNPTSPATQASPLVGTWVLNKVTITNPDNTTATYTPQQMGTSITMIFNADNTGQIMTTDSTGTTTESGSYTYSGGQLVLKDTNGQTQTLQVTISGNTLTMPAVFEIQGVQVNAILEFKKTS